MSRQQPQFGKLPVAEATSRQKYTPTASDLSAILRADLQGADQKTEILRAIVGNQPRLTPLPEIAMIAAMYPPRIKELREDLKGYGLGIQCYYETVANRGRNSRHSWYRIERGLSPTLDKLTCRNEIGSNTKSTSELSATLIASPGRTSTMLDWETGRRIR